VKRALACLALLSACHAAPHAPAQRTLVDAIGRTVALGEVKRVVSLAPSSTEIVYALGAGAMLVGVDRYSDYPSAARALPQLGTDMAPSVETIVALKPDVVLVATSANAQRSLDLIGRTGVPVYVSRADSLNAIYADIAGIGAVLGRELQAKALVATMRTRAAAVGARYAAEPPTSAAVIVWPQPLVVAARGSHVGDLVEAAGGRNVVTESTQPYPTYSTERLVKLSPEVIIVGTHATDPPSLAALDALTAIPAVRDHRVHLVDGDLLFRPGPRVVDGIEALAALLHPATDGGAR
jgi:iron complex transport system substrate-binding protein